MGDRSQTIYAIVGPKEQMLAFLASSALQDPEIGKALRDCVLMPYDDKELVLVLDAPDWKWYDSYSEIAAHNAIWDLAETHQEDFDLRGAFCQVGENTDDNTEKFFGDDAYELVSLQRNVSAHFDIDKSQDIRK